MFSYVFKLWQRGIFADGGVAMPTQEKKNIWLKKKQNKIVEEWGLNDFFVHLS